MKTKLQEEKQNEKYPFVVGKNYMIRTITMIYTGKLVEVFEKELVLTECAWIPETKRWTDTCKNGEFEEVEPYPKEKKIIIGRDAILDAFEVDWKLPDKQK